MKDQYKTKRQLIEEVEELRLAKELSKSYQEPEEEVEKRTGELRVINKHLLEEIARRKESEETLRESEERYRRLIEAANDAIFIADADTGIIINANSKAEELLGKPLEEIIGMHQTQFHAKEDADHYGRVFKEHVQRGKGVIVEDVLVCHKNGQRIPTEVSTSVTRFRGKNIIQGIFRDVSQWKKSEKELKDARDFLSNILENSLDAVVVTDDKGYIIRANEAFLHLVSYGGEEAVGKHTSAFAPMKEGTYESVAGELVEIDKKFLNHLQSTMSRFVEKKKMRNTLSYYLRKDNKVVPVEDSMVFLFDTNGRKIGGVAIVRNITDRKRAEDALRKSEEKYHSLIKHANDAIVSINRAGMIIGFNKKAEEMFGYPYEEILGKPSYLLVAQQGRENQKKMLEKFAETGTSVYMKNRLSEGKGLRKDGKEFDIEFSYYIIDLHGESIATAIIRDISERKEAERKIVHNQEQLRSLASQLTAVEEQERRNIASYLHDHLGQELFAMKLQLEQLKKSPSAHHTITTLESVIARTNQMMSDIRSMSYELSPPILYALGLEAALEWIVEEMRTLSPFTISFTDDGQAKPLDEDTKVLLFQAVRELLHNVSRHAQAQNAEISVARNNTMVVIQVNDDGVGCEASQTNASRENNQGFGLYSIKERLHYIGGNLAVESARNRGTKITLKAPLKS